MSTAAETFREINNLADEARQLLALGRDSPASRSAAGYMLGVQRLAQNGLQDALANESKLAALPTLFCAATKLIAEYDHGTAMASALHGNTVAEDLFDNLRAATATTLKPNTGEPT